MLESCEIDACKCPPLSRHKIMTARMCCKDAQEMQEIQDIIKQNEDIKKQLLDLQEHLGGKDLLQHCKGLEKQLARKQKKITALEAINESLRQQLSRQKLNLQCAGTRRSYGLATSSASDSVLGHPGLESVFENHVKAISSGDDGTKLPLVRTWTRCLANGIVSPCRNVVNSENGSHGDDRVAQVWLERVFFFITPCPYMHLQPMCLPLLFP